MTTPRGDAALVGPLAAREVPRAERRLVLPLLLLAEPSASALEWSLEHLSDTVHRFDVGETLVGAATMRWGDEPAELVELAVAPAHQGTGIGRRIVAWLVEEGRRRGRRAIEVGTASTSLANIAFYQKCGFRPSGVRRDYFWYYHGTVMEHDIPVRDMLVFRFDLVPAEPTRRARRSGR